MRKTKTSQIETAIADIFAVLNGKGEGMDKDSILSKMVNKDHNPDIVHTALKEMNRFGGIIFTTDKKYFMPESLGMGNSDPLQIGGNITDTKTETKTPKQENAMKTETTKTEKYISPIDQIIENLKSGKKEHTLKQAKKDAAKIGFTDTKDIRTKKDLVMYMTGCEMDAPVKETSSLVVDTIPEEIKEPVQEKQEPVKTRIAIKNHDRIAALQSCLDLLNTVLNTFDTNTLKQNKKSVSGILNTVSRKYLDNSIVGTITELNKIAVKNEYKACLQRETIPAIAKGIEYENELQDKEPTKIDISDKAKMLSPDLAMVAEQHDIKEKSRFDCLYEMMKNQDKKIKSLSDLVQCHKDTINILINRLNTKGNGNDTQVTKTPVKQDKKPIKSAKEIQAENRQAYIKGLKGIDKAVFDLVEAANKIKDTGIITNDLLEDFSPKQVKSCIADLVKIGLFDCTKNEYSLATVESFKGNVKDTKKQDKSTKEPKTKKTFARGKKSVKNILIDALKTGEYTCQELRDIVIAELPDRDENKTLKTVTGCVYSHIPKAGYNVIKNGKKFSIK